MKAYQVIFGLLLLIAACKPTVVPPIPVPEDTTYIFVGHPRFNDQSIQRMDPGVEQIPYDQYDAVLLGGDLTANSSREDSTMRYLDALLDLGSPTTLLAVGNHDVDNIPRLNDYTGRPTFYSHHQDGITFVVFDTQRDRCSIKDEQLDMIKAITDTISKSDQLVIIHHKLLWMPKHSEMDELISKVSNAGYCNFEFCLFENNFWDDVYPLLAEVQSLGIDVIIIGGDTGGPTFYFDYKTPEGIQLIASGVNEGKEGNEALVFVKDGSDKTLIWERVLVDSL